MSTRDFSRIAILLVFKTDSDLPQLKIMGPKKLANGLEPTVWKIAAMAGCQTVIDPLYLLSFVACLEMVSSRPVSVSLYRCASQIAV